MQGDEAAPTQLWQYTDHGHVSIRPAEAPADEYVNEWWEIEWLGTEFPHDWLVSQLKSMPDEVGSPPYGLDIREGTHEWGASAGFFEAVLYMSASGIAGGAAWDLVKWLAKETRSRIAARASESDRPAALTKEEVQERAKWLLNRRFSEPTDHLTLVSEERNPSGGTSVAFSAPSGWRYTCTYEIQDNILALCTLRRERIEPERGA